MKSEQKWHKKGRQALASVLAAAMAVSGMPTVALANTSESVQPKHEKTATASNADREASPSNSDRDTAGDDSMIHFADEDELEVASGSNAQGDWKLTYFGPSTKKDLNKGSAPDGIDGDVTLYSCTYNDDGSIKSKGGKFVSSDPADGLTFYYTTIDPSTENFYLQADVTIDYMNPNPDGQEGFALMVRDMIGNEGETGSFESNLASVTGTQLPLGELNSNTQVKDLVGVRNYTGIDNPSSVDSDVLRTHRMGFDPNGTKMKAGDTYRVSLEKTSYAYITKQYDLETNEEIGAYVMYIPAKDSRSESVESYDELDDPMSIQDENAYVGLAVARGLNATFSNITFTTSEFDPADWERQPTTYVDPDYRITSPDTAAEDSYTLVFRANADGVADITQNGEIVDEGVEIAANEEFSKSYQISGDSEFAVTFTPDPDYKISAFEELSSYEPATITKQVTHRQIGNEDGVIYVSPSGSSQNNGSDYDHALDVATALSYATAGQTILLESATYDLSNTDLVVARGRNGSEEAPITMKGDGGYATFDFGRSGKGWTLWGNYWHISFINVTGTKDGSKGMQVAGNHNVIERMNFYNNGNTGLQISGTSEETIEKWPSYNTILNCTSMNNADSEMEDADGFAAKLTCGVGNVFDGCIAAYNADDGWDFFAKVASGSIGAVTIQNSVAYRNGYIMATAGSTKKHWNFGEVYCNENGTLTMDEAAELLDAGNGNGFKMGGSNMPGDHKLKNSISYENKAKGFDSNSCPDIKIYDSTSFNNESYNVAMYTSSKSATTDFAASGILSFRTEGKDVDEQIAPQNQQTSVLYTENNYYWDTQTQTSHNTASKTTTVSADWFENLDTSVEPERNEDGTINMHGLLLLNETGLQATDDNAGARGTAWGQEEVEKATIWVVGDSTVSAFNDAYYLPREGYGEELSRYLNANVYNLAKSGASSKDFTTMENYETLLNGNDTVPALGTDSDNTQFLLIGFGHNDEKTEEARYTNPNGDYKTEGSFANSLYEHYIKVAQERGVTPILCTPIVRLTKENTLESYNSASGHITADTEINGKVFAGGDYADAIKKMCEELGYEYIDLTTLTKELNVQLGDEAQWMHSFTGAKYGEDESLVATGIDPTHTNSYGAKTNAWLIANADTSLNKYSKHKEMPSYEADFADAINSDYQVSDYQAPTETSSIWQAFEDADGNVWNGSVFGNVGGQDKITSSNFTSQIDGQTLTLGVTGDRGKIASTADGLMMYYMAIPAGTKFTLSATATINAMKANNQVSFGLMARDDMYVDTNLSAPIGDYVAAGTRNQGAVNGFGRKSGAIYDGPQATKVYGVGDTVNLQIVGTADGYTLTYGENDPVSVGFDYPLTAIDPDWIYVGCYVARNCNVTFSNIHLVTEEEPDQPDQPDKPDQPDQPDQPDKPDQPETPDQPDVPAVKPERDSDDENVTTAKTYSESHRSYSEEGTWTSRRAADGSVIWNCTVNGKPVIGRWAHLSNSYHAANQADYGWFAFDENGQMRTGWFEAADGHWYYLNPTSNGERGMMMTGWQLIDGKYYYFNQKSDGTLGAMLVNTTTPDGYRVGADGAWMR